MELKLPSRASGKIVTLFGWVQKEFPFSTGEFSDLLIHAKDGLQVEIRPLEFDHTRKQENYYRKSCRAFADYCGMTPDEMHEEILCTAYGSKQFSTKFGVRRRPLQRSGGSKRGDYSHLIDTLIRVAAEMGFDITPAQR